MRFAGRFGVLCLCDRIILPVCAGLGVNNSVFSSSLFGTFFVESKATGEKKNVKLASSVDGQAAEKGLRVTW